MKYSYAFDVDGHLSVVPEDDVLGVVHNRILLHNLRWAVGLLNLTFYVSCSIFHKDGRLWVTL